MSYSIQRGLVFRPFMLHINIRMKYAITGHTYGIGEGLYNRLMNNSIGFSKSTGYDITKKKIDNV